MGRRAGREQTEGRRHGLPGPRAAGGGRRGPPSRANEECLSRERRGSVGVTGGRTGIHRRGTPVAQGEAEKDAHHVLSQRDSLILVMQIFLHNSVLEQTVGVNQKVFFFWTVHGSQHDDWKRRSCPKVLPQAAFIEVLEVLMRSVAARAAVGLLFWRAKTHARLYSRGCSQRCSSESTVMDDHEFTGGTRSLRREKQNGVGVFDRS